MKRENLKERIRQVADSKKQELMGLPNVVGVGVGYKRIGGKATRNLAVVVLVEKKLPKAQLAPEAVVPQTVDDIVTDVIEVGEVRALGIPAPGNEPEQKLPNQQDRRARWRPARPGVSLGHYKITAGTFGAVVIDRQTKKPVILSNNHVLANATNGRDRRAKKGDPVLQPGPYDGGRENDVIAGLYRFVPIRFRRPGNRTGKAPSSRAPYQNLVDAAIAEPVSAGATTTSVLELGEIKGAREPYANMILYKSGRTTGLTSSRVLALHVTLSVSYGERKEALFADQIVAGPMCDGGDSGSAVLDSRNRLVGLLFAGSDRATIINPIQHVFKALDIELQG